jgi:hypothetical protein
MILGEVRDHLAIQERPGRLAVQAENDLPVAFIEVVHTHSLDLGIVGLKREPR